MESIKHIDKLKDYIRKDVELLLGALIENYDIYKNGEPVNKTMLYNKLTGYLSNMTRCNAVINGKLCKMKRVNNFEYCKKHLIPFNTKSNNEQFDILKPTGSIKNECLSKECFSKRLIDDTFYYIDKNNEFIYDDNLERVGYINGDYIFTDDPFILDSVK